MNTRHGLMYGTALLLGCMIAPPVHSAEPKLPRDGWASWEVAAIEGAPDWCCFGSWKDRRSESMNGPRAACKLDGRSNGYGNRHDATTETVKVYARTAGGKIDRLQVLSATCPVETRTPVQELDGVSVDESARWLSAQAKQDGKDAVTREPIAEGALAALAMHRGDLASNALAGFARDDARMETRKWAVFWLSQLRGTEGADITSSVMFNDEDADVREHAAFALSQSNSPRVAPDLIRLGNTDKVGEVRGQAWFWLAQNGAQPAEDAIVAALSKESDAEVREQAVFALSQLPDERATRALIAMAEDKSLAREQRRQAVFWLSQSDSDAALAYLEQVLARNAAK